MAFYISLTEFSVYIVNGISSPLVNNRKINLLNLIKVFLFAKQLKSLFID
jgi:hypothetical protein